MPIIRRNLAVHFQKSVKVTTTGSTPQSVEVTVIPLQDASNAALIATYVGGPQTASATLLDDDNVITFALVPSNFPGLTNSINYRIMWRVGGVTGRTETYDFAMPDVDISFDQLQSTGNIINGTAYLQQADLGVPGRVAKLNDLGKVVDSTGEPVATLADVANLQGELDDSVASIEQQAYTNQQSLLETLSYQTSLTETNLITTLRDATTGWNRNLREEVQSRVNAVTSINETLTSLSNSLISSSLSFSTSIESINETLPIKADLDTDGKVPLAQIPPEAITNWIKIDSALDRLSLIYPDDVQVGDVVISPTGIYALTGTNPSLTNNWSLLNQVLSVNGKSGTVVLSASDVGAIASDATIPQSQIAGLPSALAELTPTSTTTTLQNRVTAIENDANIVRLNENDQIDSNFLDSGVAYINVLNQVVKKDGTIISDPADRGVLSVNGKKGTVTLNASDVGAYSSSTTIAQDRITNLPTVLNAKANLTNGKIPIGELPLAIPQSQIDGLEFALSTKATLTSGHLAVDLLPLSIPQSRIANLAEIVSGNLLTTSSNAIGRIDSLERRVGGLEAGGGGGGGGGTSTMSPYWEGTTSSDVLQQNFVGTITFNSPFGIYSSGANAGDWYYNKDGVPSGDAAYPVITPNGHLKLYKWNEAGAEDPTYATSAQLKTVSDAVAALDTAVSRKVEQTSFNTLSSTVSGLSSNKADLDSITRTLVASQVPFIAKQNPKVVASTAAMLALTTSQVHAGDQCIVLGSGTYTLVGSNPASINTVDGWVLHPVPAGGGGGSGTVTTISGPSGTKIYPDGSGNISLRASDLGAVATTTLSSYVTSDQLSTTLSSYATTSQVTSIASSSLVRGRVDYVVRSFQVGNQTYCANGVPVSNNAPYGSPAIDKDALGNLVYAYNTSLILLTNQSDSKYNGIWRVNTGGAWSRPSDYATGSSVLPNTIVMVKNVLGSTAGSGDYTLWQNWADTTAVIDTGITRWRNLGSIAPLAITGANGITVGGQYPNITIGADVEGGFVRKFNVTVTPTSAVYTVTHGLNTMYPQVTVIDANSGAAVLVGWKVNAPTSGRYDSINLEFNSSSYNNSYRIVVHG